MCFCMISLSTQQGPIITQPNNLEIETKKKARTAIYIKNSIKSVRKKDGGMKR